MIVLVAGMQRSGSTFSFNIVREVLERRGSVYQEAAYSLLPVIANSGEADHIIQKAHDTDQATMRLLEVGAIKSICTVRKIEDAIASWMTVFGFGLSESISHMEAWLGMYRRIRHHSLTISYEEIEQHPARAAWQIAKYICPEIEVREVASTVRKFSRARVKAVTDALQLNSQGVKDLGFSYYDEKTFLHRGHVGVARGLCAEERIGNVATTAIRQAFRNVLDGEGNLDIDNPIGTTSKS